MTNDPRTLIASAPMSPFQILAVALCVILNALDGFDVLAITFAAPGIVKDWELEPGALGIVISSSLGGMIFGSFGLAPLADIWGRRPVILICLAAMSAGMLLSATATDVYQLAAWRVVTGVCIGGMLAAITAMSAEYANERHRSLCVSLMTIGYPIGGVFGGLITVWLLQHFEWRAIFVFGGGVSVLLLPIVWWRLPESVEFLMTKRPENAHARINRILAPMKLHGFTEQEFYVRGEASRYRIDDVTRDARKIDSGHPYVTRVLVRRPVDSRKFNGSVVVEWLNVSTGQDVDFLYAGVRELLLRDGYVWVGVSAQRVGVEQLTRWNPARYGQLTVAASGVDPADGKELDPGRPGTPMVGGDVLSWDIYSQVAAAIRDRTSPLMGGLKVRHVIAAGQSQSSFRLSNYFNSIQPLHRLYEGFLLYDRGAAFVHRSDVDAKLISLGTEFLNVYLHGSPPPDAVNQRWWELAGASHNSLAEIEGYIDPVIKRDAALKDASGATQSITDSVSNGNCAVTPLWSRVPNGDVLKAALNALNTWVKGGAPPPGFPRLTLDSSAVITRDAEGRALGGIRTAALDAPRSRNAGVSSGAGMCLGAGYHLDFSEQQLCQRYGSHETYVRRVAEIATANVKAGVLLPEEEKKTLKEARALDFKCGG